jgi:gliding motility-associated-like protein
MKLKLCVFYLCRTDILCYMVSLKSLVLVVLVIAILEAVGQCNFQEDYSSAMGWTQVGVNVEIANGRLNYLNGAECHTSQRRVHAQLGTSLDSHDCWIAELEFTPQQVGVKNGLPYTGHVVLALTAGTQDIYNDCPDLPCTGFPNGTQDGLVVAFMARNPPTGDVYFRPYARDDGLEYGNNNNVIVAPYLDTTYYVRAARPSPTQFTISVFWDAARTNQLPNSPIVLTIPAGLTGLTTVQHANTVRGEVRRKLWGYLDNLCISWGNNISGNFLPPDTSFCSGDSITLNIGQGASASYLWSTGSMDSVVTISQGGTYWAKIEIGCNEVYDTIIVNVDTVNVQLPVDTVLCPGEQLLLDIGNGPLATYSWNTGSTDSIILVTQPGIYIGTASSICTASDTIVVDYYAPLLPQLKDTAVCDGFTVILSYQAIDAIYLWSTGETSPSIVVNDSGMYSLEVITSCDTLIDSAWVYFQDCAECRIFIPNAFSPGNDGLNERFEPITNCSYVEYTLKIFDRWGKIVADLTQEDSGWDGTVNGEPLPIGVYAFRLEYAFRKTIPYQRDWINGYVMLLR